MSANSDLEARGASATVTLANGERRKLTVTPRVLYRMERHAKSIDPENGTTPAFLRMAQREYMEGLSLFFSFCWDISQDEALDLIDTTQILDYMKVMSITAAAALGRPVSLESVDKALENGERAMEAVVEGGGSPEQAEAAGRAAVAKELLGEARGRKMTGRSSGRGS